MKKYLSLIIVHYNIMYISILYVQYHLAYVKLSFSGIVCVCVCVCVCLLSCGLWEGSILIIKFHLKSMHLSIFCPAIDYTTLYGPLRMFSAELIPKQAVCAKTLICMITDILWVICHFLFYLGHCLSYCCTR